MSEAVAPRDERTPEQRRSAAIAKFQWDAGTYVLVNLGLVITWLVAGHGTFWPIWPIVFWGIVVIGNAIKTFTTDYDPDDDYGYTKPDRRTQIW